MSGGFVVSWVFRYRHKVPFQVHAVGRLQHAVARAQIALLTAGAGCKSLRRTLTAAAWEQGRLDVAPLPPPARRDTTRRHTACRVDGSVLKYKYAYGDRGYCATSYQINSIMVAA